MSLTSRRVVVAGLLALPLTAWAKKDKPPRVTFTVGGRLEHRRAPVDRDEVRMRFDLFDDSLVRDPVWSEEAKLAVEEGKFTVILGKRGTLGDMSAEMFKTDMFLGVTLVEMGPEVQNLRLAPRIRIRWANNGTADCLAIDDSLAGGSCGLHGEGNVNMFLEVLQRAPLAGSWTPPPPK